MDNPYRAPQADTSRPAPVAATLPGLRRSSWAVRQVRTVATLLIIQGAFETLFGLVLAGMAIFLFVVFNQPNARLPPGTDPLQIVLLYSFMSAMLLLPGGLHIWAGVVNLMFRSYTLGLVSLGASAFSIFSCICAPTGIALMIYGLIVYVQPEVPESFQLGESGQEVDVILHAYK